MNKNNIFDFLENSEDGDLEMIYRLTPELSDEQFERILTMSKKRRNIMKKSNERNIKMIQKNPDTVSGVDIYKRPSWTRILATAASFVILAGGLAFGFHLMRKSDSPAPPLSSDAQSTSNTSTTTSIVTTSTQPAEDTYRAECEKAMNEIERNKGEAYELIAHISDHIDMNDTFEVNVHDSYCDPGTEPIVTNSQITYARYTNTKFGSLDEMRDFYIEYAVKYVWGPDWEYTSGSDMDSHNVERYFDTRVQPGDTLNTNSWDKSDIIPMYTEYNGKIYKLVAKDSAAFMTDAEYWEKENNSDLYYILGDCSADAFDIYYVYYNPDAIEEMYGRAVPVKKENGKWVRDNTLQKEISVELCRELCEKHIINNQMS